MDGLLCLAGNAMDSMLELEIVTKVQVLVELKSFLLKYSQFKTKFLNKNVKVLIKNWNCILGWNTVMPLNF